MSLGVEILWTHINEEEVCQPSPSGSVVPGLGGAVTAGAWHDVLLSDDVQSRFKEGSRLFIIKIPALHFFIYFRDKNRMQAGRSASLETGTFYKVENLKLDHTSASLVRSLLATPVPE